MNYFFFCIRIYCNFILYNVGLNVVVIVGIWGIIIIIIDVCLIDVGFLYLIIDVFIIIVVIIIINDIIEYVRIINFIIIDGELIDGGCFLDWCLVYRLILVGLVDGRIFIFISIDVICMISLIL